jgi:hypothetical protein
MVVDALGSDDVAIAIGPDAVAAVLALLERVERAAFAAVGNAGSLVEREKLRAFLDLGDGLDAGFNVDAGNGCGGQGGEKSGDEDETHLDR